jgi:uncharacterized membrane protein
MADPMLTRAPTNMAQMATSAPMTVADAAMAAPSQMSASMASLGVPGLGDGDMMSGMGSMDNGEATSLMSAESGEVSDEAADSATTMAESAMMGSEMGSMAKHAMSWSPMSWLSSKGMMWTFIALGCVLAVVAFVLVIIIYVRERRDHKHLKATFCKSKECCCEIKRLRERLEENEGNAQTVLGTWSFTEATFTGTNAQQPMLLSAATPLPLVPATDAQSALWSVLPAPFAGSVTALTVEANAVPTAGSATFVLTVNGVASTLAATINSASTSPVAMATTVDGIEFLAGDLIGVAFSTTALALTAPPTFTAQLYANFTA